MKKIFTLLLIICASIYVKAQTKDIPNNIGIIGGLTQYNGDLGQGFYKSSSKSFGGLAFSRYINSHFDFVFNAAIGRLSFAEKNKTHFDSKLMDVNIHFRVKLLSSDAYKLVPFIFGGVGFADYSNYELKTNTEIKVDNPNGNGFDVFVPFGAGLQLHLSEKFSLLLQETFAYTDHDNRDGETGKSNDGFLLHTVGLSYNFGKGKDSDNDGVKDARDKCPNTPKGFTVDVKGCPLDKDHDGVADFRDSCPDVKGPAIAHGCPDIDGDGIADKYDECPDVAGTIDAKGCPDQDADGVADKEDACPLIPGSIQTHGCPDRDDDRVADAEDACPDIKGTLIMRGCIDSDSDGIADNMDKCPNEKGLAANNGCPDVNADAHLDNLLFASDHYSITKAHRAILDKGVQTLLDNPLYEMDIEGHADNVGDDKVNLVFSEVRANVVMKYFLKKGITADRLKATGYGETKPVESNSTSAGRAKNRRVELKVALP